MVLMFSVGPVYVRTLLPQKLSKDHQYKNSHLKNEVRFYLDSKTNFANIS